MRQNEGPNCCITAAAVTYASCWDQHRMLTYDKRHCSAECTADSEWLAMICSANSSKQQQHCQITGSQQHNTPVERGSEGQNT
jgi:hypothetical protein